MSDKKSKGLHREIVGEEYGRLTVLEINMVKGRYYASCLCNCGSEKVVRIDALKGGQTRSCGCLSTETKKKKKLKDINKLAHKVGDVHEELSILDVFYIKDEKGSERAWAKCSCRCGSITDILLHNFKKQKSCGCLKKGPKEKLRDSVGQVYGLYTVVGLVKSDRWQCKVQCVCGVIKTVEHSALCSGRVVSCGCKGWKDGFIGSKYGRLTVTGVGAKKNGHYGVTANCECGGVWIGTANNLRTRNNPTRSCGCIRSEDLAKRRSKDLRGERFGRLKAIRSIREDNKVKWECICSCKGESGHRGEATVLTAYLISGHTASCGCLSGKQMGEEFSRKVFEEVFSRPFPKQRPSFLLQENGYRLELDGYNEELALAFEYQGQQHNRYIPYFHKGGEADFEAQKARDKWKAEACEKNGVRLVCIPDCNNTKNLAFSDLVDFVVTQCRGMGFQVERSFNELENIQKNLFSLNY